MEFSKHVLLLIYVSTNICVYGVASTNFTDESSKNELNATTVTEGGTFSIAANVSQTDKDSNLQFYYLTLDGPVNRIMKLPKGTDGLGDCYRGALFQDCQSKFSMRYSADYTELVNITITRLTKLLAGKYQLYSYHTGANGQHNPHPLVEFALYIQDAPLTSTTMTGLPHIPTELPSTEKNHKTKAPRAKSQALGRVPLSFAIVVSCITVFFMA